MLVAIRNAMNPLHASIVRVHEWIWIDHIHALSQYDHICFFIIRKEVWIINVKNSLLVWKMENYEWQIIMDR